MQARNSWDFSRGQLQIGQAFASSVADEPPSRELGCDPCQCASIVTGALHAEQNKPKYIQHTQYEINLPASSTRGVLRVSGSLQWVPQINESNKLSALGLSLCGTRSRAFCT